MRVDYRGIPHKKHAEEHSRIGEALRDIILGGQDGLVNILGLVLGVASATMDTGIVLVAGLASLFAESVSMAAVAYTSARAEIDYYFKERHREMREVEELPEEEREEIRRIYRAKGLSGKLLEDVVNVITSDPTRWVDEMMTDELNLAPVSHRNPVKESMVVGFASVVGSFIPLIAFFLMPVSEAIPVAVFISVFVLFVAGAVKAKITVGTWWKSGLEMAFVGFVAALLGYWIGAILGSTPLFG
ncbi:VIT1/CCC1 transporter family protein [Candidatus Micrarchaeota archaeon]|nr:VIT1/CCC1 transporter family protein [Candidatus Micrarchaeota archaeon]